MVTLEDCAGTKQAHQVSVMTVSEKTSMDKLVDDLLQNYLQRIRGVRYEIDAMEKSIKALLESRK